MSQYLYIAISYTFTLLFTIIRCDILSNISLLTEIHIESYQFDITNNTQWLTNHNKNEIISCTIDIPLLCIYASSPTQLFLNYENKFYDFSNDNHWSHINKIQLFHNNNDNHHDSNIPSRRRLRGVRRGRYVGIRHRKRFRDAERYCRRRYRGTLASISNHRDNSQVRHLCNSLRSGHCWIGLRRPFRRWRNGRGVRYRYWQPGEPNNWGRNEDCTEMYGSGRWNDIRCNVGRAFICEVPRRGVRGARGVRGHRGRRGVRGRNGRKGGRGRDGVYALKRLFRRVRRAVRGQKKRKRRGCRRAKCGGMMGMRGMGGMGGMRGMGMGGMSRMMGGMGGMGMNSMMGGMGMQHPMMSGGMGAMGMQHPMGGMGGMGAMGGMGGMGGMGSMGAMGGMGGMGAMGGMGGMGMQHSMMGGMGGMGGMGAMGGMGGMGMQHPMMGGMGGMGAMGGMQQQKTSKRKKKKEKEKTKKEKKDKSKEKKKAKKKKKEKKKKPKGKGKEKKKRRLMIEDDYNIDTFIIEKCVMTNGNIWICVMYNYYNNSIWIDYNIVAEGTYDKPGHIETNQWIVSNDEGNGGNQCNDNLISTYSFNEICIEKWTILMKKEEDNEKDIEFSLIEKGDWNEIYYINGDKKRLCRDILKSKLCVELSFDDKSKDIKQINKISLEKALQK